jgi:hypothetical protein
MDSPDWLELKDTPLLAVLDVKAPLVGEAGVLLKISESE